DLVGAGLEPAPGHLSLSVALGHDGEAAFAAPHVAKGPMPVDQVGHGSRAGYGGVGTECDDRLVACFVERDIERGALAALPDHANAAREVDREIGGVVEAHGLQR